MGHCPARRDHGPVLLGLGAFNQALDRFELLGEGDASVISEVQTKTCGAAPVG